MPMLKLKKVTELDFTSSHLQLIRDSKRYAYLVCYLREEL